MVIAVIGSGGQLGRAMMSHGGAHELVELRSADLDIRDAAAVEQVFSKVQPNLVVNAAAYTEVDRAESEPDLAMAVNGDGVRNIAESATLIGARLVHISTDFVFGSGYVSPIRTSDKPCPISAYGRSKLAGEEFISAIMKPEMALVIRTSWLYSGSPGDFVATMMRLLSEKTSIGVVSDQVGTPTWTETLATTIYELIDQGASGLHHVTDSGVASWYDFAVAIRDLAIESGLLVSPGEIRPISTSAYPTAADRPSYSVLDKSRLTLLLEHDLPYWRHSLSQCISRMAVGKP